MQKGQLWQLVLLALGIFVGSFWTVYGFLSSIAAQAGWWQKLLAMAPGSAIIFLALMARRAPVPYGAGLLLLGLLLAAMSAIRGSALSLGLAFGMPVFILGLLFVISQKQ